jgi:hypothetical protein
MAHPHVPEGFRLFLPELRTEAQRRQSAALARSPLVAATLRVAETARLRDAFALAELGIGGEK